MSDSDIQSPEREAIIVAFLLHAALGPEGEEYFWAWEAVGDFIRGQPPLASWDLVLELVQRASSERELGLVIAGPLEELVTRHGHELLERIEQRARDDERFRAALGGIWLSEGSLPNDVLQRIVHASGGRIQPLPPIDEDELLGRDP